MKRIIGLLTLLLSLALLTGCGTKDIESTTESITDSLGSAISEASDAVSDKISEVTDSVVDGITDAVAKEVGFQLNKKKITLKVGETYQVKAPGVSAADVKWSSSNNKVVSVTEQGLIKAKKKGTAKVTATVGSKSLSCKIKVIKADKSDNDNSRTQYDFRRPDYLTEHYKKHGIEMGFESEEDYLDGANAVIANPAALHKLEAEDDDHVYFIESTGEIVFLSQDGYIRTYFISDKDYFDRQ